MHVSRLLVYIALYICHKQKAQDQSLLISPHSTSPFSRKAITLARAGRVMPKVSQKTIFLDGGGVQAGKQIQGYLTCQKHADQKLRLNFEILSPPPGPQNKCQWPPIIRVKSSKFSYRARHILIRKALTRQTDLK